MTDTTADTSALITEALARWERAEAREAENRRAAYEDLAFRAGEQWPEDEAGRLEGEGRPALTLNRIPAFVRQVTNDIRLMRPSISVVPVDGDGDPKTAAVLGGMIRYVENRSDAQAAYFCGMDSQVVAGIGHWQVLTEYASERTFDQEIRIAPIDDGVAVLWDPDAVLPTRADAMWCFQPVDLTHAAFRERYPEAAASVAELNGEGTAASAASGWLGEDFVRVARYWQKRKTVRTLALMPDGSVQEVDTPEKVAKAKKADARIEEREGFRVTHMVISAAEVLEPETDWPGRFIPIVPVLGEEVRIGRRVVRHGIIRYAKDAQRMFNYAQSAQVEAIALQPKAPWLVTEDNVKAYAAVWAEANAKPLPYLPYRPDPANGGAPPQRAQPAIASTGLSEMIAMAGQNLKDIIGIQDAGLGERSNEVSGKAILARQREGDVGMFTYVDNFTRAIRHTGAILVDLIPRIYDTKRMIRVMGEDGVVDLVPINQPVTDPDSGLVKVANDLSVGAYDVFVQPGPGYTTRREEARDGMLELAKMAPNLLIPLTLDLIAKAQDWPMADQIARRARTVIPPEVLAAEAAALAGEDAPDAAAPKPLGPAEIMALAEAELALAKAAEGKANAELAQLKLAAAQQEDLARGLAMAEQVLGPGGSQAALAAMAGGAVQGPAFPGGRAGVPSPRAG
ncbi:MAG: hypothetical protein KIS68_16060 [Bauldia sp.]|nr:hypothetical protein [Bauldia sp.]